MDIRPTTSHLRVGLRLLACVLVVISCAADTLSAQNSPSAIIYPANDAVGIDQFAPFTWTIGNNAVNYAIYIGTVLGSQNVWASGNTTATSTVVPGLQPNTLYYIRLWTEFSGNVWQYVDSSFTSGTGFAHLTAPTDGGTDVDPAVNFSWNGVLDAEVYYLYLSATGIGLKDAYDSSELPNVTSLAQLQVAPATLYYHDTRSPQPPSLQPNQKYYARMWTKKAGVWYYIDSTFTTGNGIAHLTSSTNWNGAAGVGETPTFTWNSVADAGPGPPYYLYVGTLPDELSGGVCSSTNHCVWQTGAISPTNATLPSGILQPNTTYYVRLYTNKPNHVWSLFADSAFSTGSFSSSPAVSRITYPPKGATNVDPFAPIQWTSAAGAIEYSLLVGNVSNDPNYVYFYSPQLSQQFLHLPTAWSGGLVGSTNYYATIYTYNSQCPNGCSGGQITFTTAPTVQPHNKSSFYHNIAVATAALRNTATGPYNGSSYDVPLKSTFLLNNLQPGASVAVCSDFANNLVPELENAGIVAHRRDTVFGAGPLAHSTVEYYDPIQGNWGTTDATFGVTFYDPSKNPSTMNMDQISAALVNNDPASIPYEFVSSTSVTPNCPDCLGSYWALNYPTDPMLDYLNPVKVDTVLSDGNDPLPFLLDVNNPVGIAGEYIFSFAHSTDEVTLVNGGQNKTVQPQDVTVPPNNNFRWGDFSNVVSLGTGWLYVGNPPAGLTVKRPACPVFVGPSCP